jgi:hypothetical protein
MVHYSPIMRDGFLRAMVTLLVTIPDLGRQDLEESGSQHTEKI